MFGRTSIGGGINLGAKTPTGRNSSTNMSRTMDVNSRDVSPRSEDSEQIVLEGFGGFEDAESDEEIKEFAGHCYLKTKTESYRKHWMVLSGNELRFYKKQGDEKHKVMHCLTGTYLKLTSMAEMSQKTK